jgi:hypothetical protein
VSVGCARCVGERLPGGLGHCQMGPASLFSLPLAYHIWSERAKLFPFENLNGTRYRHPSEAGPKFAIIITNQILRCLPIRRGFSKLLRNPGIGGRSCHSHVDYAPRFEFDDDERKERSKEEICYL